MQSTYCSFRDVSLWLIFLPAGRTTTPSPFHSFRRAILTPNLALVNTTLYLASAFFFGEISVFSASESAQLYLVDQGGPADRPQINERSILFRSQFIILALVQVVYHLTADLDEVILPLDKLSAQSSGSRLRAAVPLALPKMVVIAFTKSWVAMFVGLLGYYNIYRYALWNWAFSALRFTYDFPRNSAPRRTGVPGLINVEFKFLFHAFLLTFIWEITNYVFTIMIAERPMKKDQPITQDSKDPNGTLLSGLRSRRQFWKVVYTIFSHFERFEADLCVEHCFLGTRYYHIAVG
jgi:nucleoporin NDC1